MRCVATLTVRCDVEYVMWNVVQWWCGVEWCDMKGGVM